MKCIKIILSVICIFNIICTKAQNSKSSSSIQFRSGLCYKAIYNEFINFYTYTNYIPAFEFEYQNRKNDKTIINLKISGMKGQLNPLQLNDILYTYNNINFHYLSISFQYFNKLYSFNKNSRLYLGLTYSPHYSSYTQNYSNILYAGATGFRKFFDISILNLSPSICFLYHKDRNEIEIQVCYAIVNYVILPDDNYVKQLSNASSTPQYNLYWYNKYSLSSSNLQYKRWIKRNWALNLNLQFRTQKISDQSNIEIQNAAIFIGISKYF